MLLTQGPLVWFLVLPEMYCDFGEIYWQHWLVESGQRLTNVDRTHPILAKLCYYKNTCGLIWEFIQQVILKIKWSGKVWDSSQLSEKYDSDEKKQWWDLTLNKDWRSVIPEPLVVHFRHSEKDASVWKDKKALKKYQHCYLGKSSLWCTYIHRICFKEKTTRRVYADFF